MLMLPVYLGLGSNLDRQKNIAAGIAALQKEFSVLKQSRIYESESVGFKGSNFYNLVVQIETDLPLLVLSERLKKIEDEHGRIRTGPKFSPRTLDIDILTYGDYVGNFHGIQLPREEITQNAFVLLPLADIAADELHPEIKKSYRELWQDYDKSRQALWVV